MQPHRATTTADPAVGARLLGRRAGSTPRTERAAAEAPQRTGGRRG